MKPTLTDEQRLILGQKLFKILLAILDLFGSKKFLVALGGAIGGYTTTGNLWALILPLVSFVLAQGHVDYGLARANDKPR